MFGLAKNIHKAISFAVKAGQSIIQEMESLNQNYLKPHFNYRFQIGIGLHAGKAIVGNVGLSINNNFTVMGLPVNIASRLQAVQNS